LIALTMSAALNLRCTGHFSTSSANSVKT
jgi:hypothetical protein